MRPGSRAGPPYTTLTVGLPLTPGTLGSDHTTDSNTGAHTADPVPVLLFDPVDSATAPVAVNFSESACRRGPLTRTSGSGFLECLIARLESPAQST